MNFRTFVRQLRQSPYIRNVGMLASATVSGQLILVLASPVLTRLYTPNEFGLFAVFFALLSVISVVSSLRFELAIPISRGHLSAAYLLSLALYLNFGFSSLAFLMVMGLREPLTKWMKTPALAEYLWMLPIVIFLFGTFRILNYWAVRYENYRRVAYAKLLKNIANVSVQLLAGIAKVGTVGLIAGQICGQLVGGVCLALFVKKTLPANAHFSLRRMTVVAQRQRRFVLFDTPAALIDAASEQLPSLLFAVLFSPSIAGFYFLAQRTLSLPVSLIGQAMSQVLFGQCRQAIADQRLGKIVRKTVYSLIGLVLVPAIAVILWGEDVFGWVFGESWHQSGQFATWMMIGISAQFVYSPVSLVLMATDGQHINLILHSTLLIARLIGILWGWMHDDIIFAIVAFSVSAFLGYAIGTFLIIRRADHWSRPGNSRPMNI